MKLSKNDAVLCRTDASSVLQTGNTDEASVLRSSWPNHPECRFTEHMGCVIKLIDFLTAPDTLAAKRVQ